MSAEIIDPVRSRLFELIRADIGQPGSPFTAAHLGPRSNEIEFTLNLQGTLGDGLLALGVRERRA